MGGLRNPGGGAPDAEAQVMEWQGFKAWTFPPTGILSNSAVTQGRLNASPLYLKAGTVITNVHVNIGVAQVGATLIRFGLYGLTDLLEASTADIKAAWTTTGFKTHALSAPFTVPQSGVWKLGFLCTGATTLPQPLRAAGWPNIITPNGSLGYGMFSVAAGLVDLPASAVWQQGDYAIFMGAS